MILAMPLGQPNVQDDSSRMSSKKGGVFYSSFFYAEL